MHRRAIKNLITDFNNRYVSCTYYYDSNSIVSVYSRELIECVIRYYLELGILICFLRITEDSILSDNVILLLSRVFFPSSSVGNEVIYILRYALSNLGNIYSSYTRNACIHQERGTIHVHVKNDNWTA